MERHEKLNDDREDQQVNNKNTGKQPDHPEEKDKGEHKKTSAFSAASQGRSAVGNADHHSSSDVSGGTGTTTSYDSPATPGTDSNSGTGKV